MSDHKPPAPTSESGAADLHRVYPGADRIPVLWFDSRGYGPSELALQLQHFPPDKGGAIHAFLGLRVREVADGMVAQHDDPMIDGGFNLHGEQVAELHRQLGAWLADNGKRDSSSLEAERDAYRAMVCDLLASAHPNPTDHPAMSRQWARARELLKNGPK